MSVLTFLFWEVCASTKAIDVILIKKAYESPQCTLMWNLKEFDWEEINIELYTYDNDFLYAKACVSWQVDSFKLWDKFDETWVDALLKLGFHHTWEPFTYRMKETNFFPTSAIASLSFFASACHPLVY